MKILERCYCAVAVFWTLYIKYSVCNYVIVTGREGKEFAVCWIKLYLDFRDKFQIKYFDKCFPSTLQWMFSNQLISKHLQFNYFKSGIKTNLVRNRLNWMNTDYYKGQNKIPPYTIPCLNLCDCLPYYNVRGRDFRVLLRQTQDAVWDMFSIQQ